MNIAKSFVKYVSQNILGMLGVSCYILADTFFISKVAGTNGIAILNLALPIYGIIFAIGSMIGVGAATRYTIEKTKNEASADTHLFHGVCWIVILSLPIIMVGTFAPDLVMQAMGADDNILELGCEYTTIFMKFAPFFMLNHLLTNFVKNDHDPSLAMLATIASSVFNIIFDYIFMFPMEMGMKGAALATGISPILGVLLCSIHFIKLNNNLTIKFCVPNIRKLFEECQLGVSAMIGELSSAVTTTVFNFLLLSLVGNVAVAAYGVVANCALVAMALFNGIALGAQPIISRNYATGQKRIVRTLYLLGVGSAFVFAFFLIGFSHTFTTQIVDAFNSEQNLEFAAYATDALRLYFLGYLVAGFNVVTCSFFGATNRPVPAFVCSILRGVVAIVGCACILANIWGINGVFGSFLAAETLTGIVSFGFMFKNRD